MMLEEIVAKLKQIVGPNLVSTNYLDKINYQHSLAYGAYKALADVIVRVESDERGNHKLSELLRFAHENYLPIVAKGGIGMGASSPLKGGVLLDMLGLDKILEVNPVQQYVIAEGGASVYAIHHELGKHGLMLPNYGTYGCSSVIGAKVIQTGVGYGMTRYGFMADMVLGLEVVLPGGAVVRFGALTNDKSSFGPFQKWVHIPDFLGLFTLSAGALGLISKVCLRVIEGRREWLHSYCYSFREDELEKVQAALMELVKREVVYDIHFTDRWQHYWPTEEGLCDRSRIPEDAWFFLKTILFASDAKELAYKEERMRQIYLKHGGVEVAEIAEKFMGAGPPKRGLRLWPDYHVIGPGAWACSTIRHAGMFAVTSKLYPINALKEMYEIDKAAKKECGLWNPEHAPMHDSYVTRDLAVKEEYFVFYNPYDPEDVNRLLKWFGLIREAGNRKGVIWTSPTLSTRGAEPYERLGSAYEWVKEIKRLVDPHNILNPGAIY